MLLDFSDTRPIDLNSKYCPSVYIYYHRGKNVGSMVAWTKYRKKPSPNSSVFLQQLRV
jgi:hypothetical protein